MIDVPRGTLVVVAAGVLVVAVGAAYVVPAALVLRWIMEGR